MAAEAWAWAARARAGERLGDFLTGEGERGFLALGFFFELALAFEAPISGDRGWSAPEVEAEAVNPAPGSSCSSWSSKLDKMGAFHHTITKTKIAID